MGVLFNFAKRFVAGEEIEDVIGVAERLQEEGYKTTLDHLGEDVLNKEDTKKATNDYLELIDDIKYNKLDAHIAVKLTQIGLAIDKNLAMKNLQKILRKAKTKKVVVEIDMEGSDYTGDTILIYLKIIKNYPSTVLAIQAYLLSTGHDLDRLLAAKARIRLVKGAYKEPEHVAFKKKQKVNDNYIKNVKKSLKKAKYTQIATHDEAIIEEVKRFIKKNKIKKNSYEFAMLYGIKESLQEDLLEDSYPLRVYTPYGKAWFSYFYRRIRERKENLWFAVKSIIKK